MTPLYILGLLQRFGPMHGYRIKKLIEEQLADFTQIKLPTIYYHLEKMEQHGLVSIQEVDENGIRPERTVYAITEAGRARFKALLEAQLDFSYRPTFPADGLLFFSDTLDPSLVTDNLATYAKRLDKSLALIEEHRKATLSHIPEDSVAIARTIFDHHERHYRAEREWVDTTLQTLRRMR